VARFIEEFLKAPRAAEVYNLGGGKPNSCSILEAFRMVEGLTGSAMKSRYVEKPREGDHICYYSDLRKAKSHYPNWQITKSLEQTMAEIVRRWTKWQR
jgi:CDP-paratose 2-epimerase